MPLVTLASNDVVYRLSDLLTGTVAGSSRTDANQPSNVAYWNIQNVDAAAKFYVALKNPKVSDTDYDHRLTGQDDSVWDSAYQGNQLSLAEVYIKTDTNGGVISVMVRNY